MASMTGAVWAIDIGNNSLKALSLTDISGKLEVIGFSNIQHQKILSRSRLSREEREELIAISLRQFVRQNVIGEDEIIISVPSQNSFARFVTLPPVEEKRIPEIVKFEAAQQIPFDISEVQWDWQLMSEKGGAENKVGIFAIKNEIIDAALEDFNREGLEIGYVQMAPMALYNYVVYDRPELCSSNAQATAILNIGAENTDLVVCTKSTVWQRSIPMGGNSFTKAIADTFKLNFEKAEKLKRTAPMSKYARQILQAMKPVFTDLASEIQRSLGFYSGSNADIKIVKIIAFGGCTRMRGLLKYLQQSLQIPIESPDSFKKLTIGEDVSAAEFHDDVCDFGIVYGLALQGLGLGKIESNLLPHSVARSMAWASKAKYFTTAACLLLAVSLMGFGRTVFDKVTYSNNNDIRSRINKVETQARRAIEDVDNQRSRSSAYEQIIQKNFKLFEHRDVVPLLYQTIILTLPNKKNNPEQKELYSAFAEGEVEIVLRTPRKQRKQIFITNISIEYIGQLEALQPERISSTSGRPGKSKPGGDSEEPEAEETPKAEEGGPGFQVTLTGYSPYGKLREELMEPVDVQDNKDKWGVITRMENLDEVVDGNSPFRLYGRGKSEHFDIDIGEVAFDNDTPEGIGIKDEIVKNVVEKGKALEKPEKVLLDQMTKEIISRVPQLDENGLIKKDRKNRIIYKANDHWFKLGAKFVWRQQQSSDETSTAVQER
ncbi:MAG: type IV pilus assembly protein PilM [Planctomycetota bacterium]|jgi:type IV pilus assembly protein PilM